MNEYTVRITLYTRNRKVRRFLMRYNALTQAQACDKAREEYPEAARIEPIADGNEGLEHWRKLYG